MLFVLHKVILESDSLIGIKSILDRTQVSKQINTLIADIRFLASKIENIRFSYRSTVTHILADRIARKLIIV